MFSPSQRSAEDLEVIYEELLHVKAAAHLSTSVSRALLMKAAELLIPVCVEAEREREKRGWIWVWLIVLLCL